ncbi:hypothetical protein MSSIT_1731 [Methanosarcina siciliae T4/M]|uniref:Uncharacterized protein n=2 Tax=Methanosarcina siciliae TaxID=38027 RepID=A0A0E3PE39_9EURY|nr:hypothetical protein [Methanosarcina siciliae]AKB28450.1 hypothetical protein MSSIT_1731 [Methanosarcina siciliae T4/M]AKB32360.1 hypothetical protein MSSIH_1670 [Methanosarcina siciliae HI350]
MILLDTIESCERFIEGMDFDEFVSDEKNTFVLRHPLKIIVVWKTANERLPELKKDIEKILKEKNLY